MLLEYLEVFPSKRIVIARRQKYGGHQCPHFGNLIRRMDVPLLRLNHGGTKEQIAICFLCVLERIERKLKLRDLPECAFFTIPLQLASKTNESGYLFFWQVLTPAPLHHQIKGTRC